MDEEQYHINAFETYYILRQSGATKTDAVTGVSQEWSRSKSTIWEWKKEFNWDEKVAIRSAKINKNIQDKTDATIEENKVRYLGIVHSSINKYVRDVKKKVRDPLEINSTLDLYRLLKIALELQDEAVEDKTLKIEVDNKTKENEVPEEVIKEFGTFLIQRERNSEME